MSESLWTHGLYSPWNSPGQNTAVGIPFSRGSSQPRDWTQVSRIAGRFFTSWATRKDGRITKLIFLTVKIELGKFVNGPGISKCERLGAMEGVSCHYKILVLWSSLKPTCDVLIVAKHSSLAPCLTFVIWKTVSYINFPMGLLRELISIDKEFTKTFENWTAAKGCHITAISSEWERNELAVNVFGN